MITVRINGVPWKIEGCKEDAEILKEDDEEVFGITYYGKSEIYVRTENVSEKVLYRTIVHELVHAWIYSTGYTEAIAAENSEESVANFMESYGESLLRMAKKIYKALLPETGIEPKPRIVKKHNKPDYSQIYS